MDAAVWSSITVFATDPRATGRLYSNLGATVRIVDAGLVEVSLPAGPVIRVAAADVPSRTHMGIRMPQANTAAAALDNLGLCWKPRPDGTLVVRDPDWNYCYAAAAAGNPRRSQLAMWSLFVTDVDQTADWIRELLGPWVFTRRDRIGAVGSGDSTTLREDVTFLGANHTLALLPAGSGRVTQAALGFEVPDLDAVVHHLGERDWSFERRTAVTVVVHTPDGNPVYLTPRLNSAEVVRYRRAAP